MTIINKAVNWLIKSVAGRITSMQSTVGGSDSYSGEIVNQQTAMQIATVWACIRLIAETIATLPMIMYERDAKGGRNVARDHWLYRLLHDQPNANMTAVEFWECVVSQLCLWGNAYVLKTYIGNRIVSLDPLKPNLMQVKTDVNGDLFYIYTTSSGLKTYTEKEIWHVKGFGIDGLVGLSPVSYARNSLGAAIATDRASGKLFANGMRAGGALTMQNILTKEQREQIRESMAAQLAGTANTGKLMVLEGGSTYQSLSMNPDDVQMLETRAFQVEEICRWFRVPPFMIGHSEKSTSWGTGLEQQMIGFLTFALRPYLTRLEQGIKKSLLPPPDRLKYFGEFSIEGLMRADSAGRAALYASGGQNGWMTRNEIRELENRPPVAGGDELTVQSNLLPINLLGKTTPDKVAKDAFSSWLGLPTFGENNES
ncbi:phage portal protein [Undibacterium sp.]|uniref:phage portal protein n=1 Tax=Undibacterium sp. TaxID=1914977 RepID=UPI0037537050